VPGNTVQAFSYGIPRHNGGRFSTEKKNKTIKKGFGGSFPM